MVLPRSTGLAGSSTRTPRQPSDRAIAAWSQSLNSAANGPEPCNTQPSALLLNTTCTAPSKANAPASGRCSVGSSAADECSKGVPADLLVTATGYQKQEDLVAKVLGKDIAERVGPIWGLDEQGAGTLTLYILSLPP